METSLFRGESIIVNNGVIIANADGKVVKMNTVAEELTGWSEREVVGRPANKVIELLKLNSPDESRSFVDHVIALNKLSILDEQSILVSKNGKQHLVHITAISICRYNKVNRIVFCLNKLSEYLFTQKAGDYLSKLDPIINLYNRHVIDERNRCLVQDRLPMSIMIGYVHQLDLITSVFGSRIEVEMIKKIAKMVKRNCNKNSVIAESSRDTFLVLMPNTNQVEARVSAEKIVKQCEVTTIGFIPLLISFGIAVTDQLDINISEVITKANLELFEAKLRKGSEQNYVARSIINSFYKNFEHERKHCLRVAKICSEFAKKTHLSSQEVRDLWLSGLYHDIGKVFIEQSILRKPGRLTAEEYQLVQLHSEAGYRLLTSVGGMHNIAKYILAHHERWDGNGYPLGLRGRAIPLQSRIIAVADAFDAMTNTRPYKKIMSFEMAIHELKCNADTQFDPKIVDCFIEVLTSIIQDSSITQDY